MIRFETVHDGEWLTAPRWIACCDCGLVHRVRFRIRAGRVEIQVHRDRPETRRRRRALKVRKPIPRR